MTMRERGKEPPYHPCVSLTKSRDLPITMRIQRAEEWVMAGAAKQITAMVRSHAAGDDAAFCAVAL